MTTRLLRANAIRALSMDAVQKANSGHPGAPMGMADMAEVLWHEVMRFNPANPAWSNRDRFVLSNGHGSMLLYSLLYLTGYEDMTVEDLKNFRQLHSKTAGHPEYGYAAGIETTTGPLGQGLANAVGMAIAEKTLAAQFNRDKFNIVDHHTYVFMGDGCMMEGISHEVSSLAGTLGLGKLIVLYDDNGISIDGEVEDWFTDNTPKRFEAYGWQVIPNIDGHQPDAILAAIEAGKAETGKPTLICCKTIIGKGSPNKQGKEECHGAPLGVDEIALVRETLGWSHPPFEIPADLLEDWNRVEKGTALENEWKQLFADYKAAHPELAAEFERRMAGELPADFEDRANAYIAEVNSKAETVATRKASQNCLNAFGPLVPELLGGSADLAPSNLTTWSGSVSIKDDAAGNYVHYGVREFGMTAIVNGIQLHGGLRPYGATFLIFMEYARNAVRMSALMKLPVIQVYTHDSIGLGEDGPTHQPIEQLSSLRTTPHMTTWRPCDAVEMAVAWKEALKSTDGPTCLIGSRQGLAHQQRSPEQMENIARGGYTLKESNGKPQVILIASGSEVALVMGAASQLEAAGHAVRVVSMPSVERFLRQSDEYQAAVLPLDVQARVAVEAGATTDWYRFTGLRGEVIGMTRFGESGPAEQLMKQFGFTVENIVNKAQALIGN